MTSPLRILSVLGAGLAMSVTIAASAWDAAGHQIITRIALSRFAEESTCPEWLKAPDQSQMVVWQSGEPDRWRGLRTANLRNENEPDHYLDVEDLEPFGLNLRSVPMLRSDYTKALELARDKHPERMKPVNPAMDPAKTQQTPGYLAHAIMEHYEKTRSSMTTLRILQGLPDAATERRQLQIQQAKANVRVEMGLLAHFVGDAAQPLHTTTHHHGWVGDNPKGYTTERTIHAYIDGTILTVHKITAETVESTVKDDTRARGSLVKDPQMPWSDVLTHVERSFAKVEPLYEMKKSGELEKDAGKAFIVERLRDGGAMLGDLYISAWKASEPSAKEIEDYLKYEAKE